MSRILKPMDIFHKTDSSVCLWLNGSATAHRPIWDCLWNAAAKRFITDGGANYVIPRTELKKPNVISGDMDSITTNILKQCDEHVIKVLQTPNQEKTDFTKTLEIIVEETRSQSISQIIVLGGLSGRFDHTMATLNTLVNGLTLTETPIFVLDGENLLCVITQGTTKLHVKKKMLTGKCGIVPFCQKQTLVTLKGFKWNVENEEMKFGGLISTSNEVDLEELEITTTAPLIFTVELDWTGFNKNF